jgi:hypothetical protein
VTLDFLASYHYLKGDDKLFAAAIAPGMSTIMDSGAFSAASTGAAISLDEYSRFVGRWSDRFLWCASLDVIGDPQATCSNWLAMRDKWGLKTVPTVHFGTDPVWLRTYHREGATLIGLGGMVGKPASKVIPWLVACFRAAKTLDGVAFHGWGFSHSSTLAALPFYSVDSSGPLGSAYRFGTLSMFDPAKGRKVTIQLDGRSIYRHSDLLRHVYKVDPSQIATSVKENRLLLVRVAMASIQRHAAWLARRHRVGAPAHLGTGVPGGTRIHAVDVTEDVASELARIAAGSLA